MPFDPDSFLQKYNAQGTPNASPSAPPTAVTAQGFDADTFLKKYAPEAAEPAPQPEKHWYDVSPRGLLKGTVDALPMAGMIGGGAVGLLGAGPAGGLVTAGLGKAAGQASKDLINRWISPEEAPKDRSELYGRPAEAIVTGARDQALGDIGGKLIEAAPKAANYVASNLTGVPKQAIKTYSKFNDEVRALVDKYGPDLSQASDTLRQDITDSVKGTRLQMNNQISSTLKSNQTPMDPSAVLKALDDSINGMSKAEQIANPENVTKLKEMKDTVQKIVEESGSKGKVSPADMSTIRDYLRTNASGTYNQNGFFPNSDLVANAAKKAAANARQLINSTAPEVAEANAKLADLHDIEDMMNKNLYTVGKSDSGLLSVGRGTNFFGKQQLERLGDATGKDFVSQAEKLAAAHDLGAAKLIPGDTTGKALSRQGSGIGLGYMAGSAVGHPEIGAAIGGAATSPLALKKGIDVASGAGKLLDKAGVPSLEELSKSPTGRAMIGRMMEKGGADTIEKLQDLFPNLFQKSSPEPDDAPPLRLGSEKSKRSPASIK